MNMNARTPKLIGYFGVILVLLSLVYGASTVSIAFTNRGIIYFIAWALSVVAIDANIKYTDVHGRYLYAKVTVSWSP